MTIQIIGSGRKWYNRVPHLSKDEIKKALARGNAGKNGKPGAEEESRIAEAPKLDGFIYVPSIDIYVAKERSFVGEDFKYDWERCHKELNAQGRFMPTPHQFAEFLKFLKGWFH